MKLDIDKNFHFCIKVYIIIYRTSQNFIRIMNLLVTLYSIKVGFLSICHITAGCHSNNQLLFTAFCFLSVGWIKANGESFLPILFCPLTV